MTGSSCPNPVRQFLIEKTTQLDCAEPAFKKRDVRGFRLGQGEFARDGAGPHERVHRLLDSLGDARIAIAPKERIGAPDANPGKIAGGRSRDEPYRIHSGRIERHEAVSNVRNAARQQARRVKSRG